MSDLTARLANLPADKRAILEARLKALAAQSPARPESIPRRQISSPCPLSFSQEQLWLLDQLHPGTATYNIVENLRLEGTLDLAALQKSLDEIVRRHESLRTVFRAEAETAAQIIQPPASMPLGVTNLEVRPLEEREPEARRLVEEQARRPFNLAEGPLLRVHLWRLGEQLHFLLLNLHHIVSDGWSAGIFARELLALYRQFSSGNAAALPELPIQYADFAVWQRQAQEHGSLERERSYWKQQLAGLDPLLEVPADHVRPSVQNFRGDVRTFAFPPQLSAALSALSKREKVTPAITLLASFMTLLHRYTQHTDIVLGSPIANRNRVELENLIGYFVNVVVMRASFEGDPSFKEMLRRVQKTALDAYSHQELPFEMVVQELKPHRDPSFNPVFQVMFAMQNPGDELVELPGLRVRSLPIRTQTARLDLTLFLSDGADGLQGTLEYNTDLFSENTIDRLVDHYRTLLESIVENPEAPVSRLPLLPPSERRRLLVEWNATGRAYARERCVQELFAAQAARVPDAVALEFEGTRWTYAELNARANQLARHLQALGVGPGALVGLCVERSLDMVAGVLGVWKAGGAYVPLDPAYPPERLDFMLADAQAPVLVTQAGLAKNFSGSPARVVCVDADADLIARGSAADLPTGARPDDLAYVIYTSGSTGQPKGVEIPHSAVVNFLESMRREPGLKEDDTLLAVTTLSFDIAGLELHLPLTSGAKVVLASRAQAADGRALKELLATSGASVMQATPATWRLLLEAGWAGDARLKILCGGEALPRALADELLKRCGELWNVYGPTETTIWSTLERVTAGTGPLTIGRPIANTTIYIVDAAGQPAPIGVPGELLIGGAGVARGYRHRPELTAEKFVADPFCAAAGARVYRTGDLARWRGDGRIEFLGRLDFQVKVRGFRIELGEIETVLAQHPAVGQCVVKAEDGPGGEKRLVAYYVSAAGVGAEEASASDLRAHVKAHLPEHMVPVVYARLEKFPLTPNGKVDRQALQPPADAATALSQEFVAPRNAVETALAKIWSEILETTPLSVESGFFELGGHSLLATRVVARINKLFQAALTIRTLFENPTVAQLTVALQKLESRPGITDKIAQVIQRMESMSAEEKQKRLQTKP
ncbi:MAG: amino acid adenylation domain-containing protein [Verrucomicrobia bacterium]|nr:amino acid adenylation domain-containing protein [Verrucomicrobiota bacterium]